MRRDKQAEAREFPRELDSLSTMAEFVASYVADIATSPEDEYAAQLAVEELFTNMLKYGTGGGECVSLGLELKNGKLTITLVDFQVEAWDPRQSRTVDITASIDERQPGGLGIHFVKSMFETIDYCHKDGNSTITLTRNLMR
jgi:serine/threonine-protein kinase RsbW